MLVEDLIKELEKLPKGSTIGMIDIDDVKLIPEISIKSNKDTVYDYSVGDEISIERIENMRISNKEKICDYYIV